MLYLDPLALYIELNQDINNFIADCAVAEVVKMEKAIQPMESWKCGYYCALLALHFNPNASVNNVEKFSATNLKRNDCIVVNNIAKYISQN